MTNFKLHGSKETEELAEFTELQEATSVVITAFRKQMKERVISSILLEIQTLRKKVHDYYVTAVRQLAEAESLSLPSKNKIDFHTKVLILFESEHDFYRNIDLGHEVFCQKYKEKMGLAIFPHPTGTVEDKNKLLHQSQALKRIIHGAIVEPITMYLTRKSNMVVHIALTKFRTEFNLDATGSDTQAIMDLDPQADEGLVKNLIQAETAKATQKLCAELGQVKKNS